MASADLFKLYKSEFNFGIKNVIMKSGEITARKKITRIAAL